MQSSGIFLFSFDDTCVCITYFYDGLAKKAPDGQKLAAAKKKKKPATIVAKKGKKIEKPTLKNGEYF